MTEGTYGGNSPEDRISTLERRFTELDALVKGLTDEMLDIKAVVMKLKKEQRPPPVIQAVAPAPSRSKVGKDQDEKVQEAQVPEKPIQKEKITLKMQPDGTLRPERDTGEEIIIASARDPRNKRESSRSSSGDLIIAEEQEQREEK